MDPYFRINIVFVGDVHYMWAVNVADPNDPPKKCSEFLQLGIYGVSPVSQVSQVSQANTEKERAKRALFVLKVVRQASVVHFLPETYSGSVCLFDDDGHDDSLAQFGKIRLTYKDGSVRYLDEALCEKGIVRRVERYREWLRNANSPKDLPDSDKDKIARTLTKHIENMAAGFLKRVQRTTATTSNSSNTDAGKKSKTSPDHYPSGYTPQKKNSDRQHHTNRNRMRDSTQSDGSSVNFENSIRSQSKNFPFGHDHIISASPNLSPKKPTISKLEPFDRFNTRLQSSDDSPTVPEPHNLFSPKEPNRLNKSLTPPAFRKKNQNRFDTSDNSSTSDCGKSRKNNLNKFNTSNNSSMSDCSKAPKNNIKSSESNNSSAPDNCRVLQNNVNKHTRSKDSSIPDLSESNRSNNTSLFSAASPKEKNRHENRTSDSSIDDRRMEKIFEKETDKPSESTLPELEKRSPASNNTPNEKPYRIEIQPGTSPDHYSPRDKNVSSQKSPGHSRTTILNRSENIIDSHGGKTKNLNTRDSSFDESSDASDPDLDNSDIDNDEFCLKPGFSTKTKIDHPFSNFLSKTVKNRSMLSDGKCENSPARKDTASNDSVVSKMEVTDSKNNTSGLSDSGSRELLTLMDPKTSFDYIDNMVTPKLIAHSKFGRVRFRWTSLSRCNFPRGVFDNLAERVEEPKSIQSVVWPGIMRGHSAYVVGPSGSGKIMSILPALCGLLLDTENFNSLPATDGPLALIVCPSSKTAQGVLETCKFLLRDVRNGRNEPLRLALLDNNLNDFRKASILKRGCDLLITTPTIIKLTEYKHSNLDVTRLAYFVLINADILDVNFRDDVSNLYRFCKETAHRRSNQDVELKILMESKTWCSLLRTLLMETSNPLLCISSFQEALLYAKINMNVFLVSRKNKINKLVGLLKDKGRAAHRSIIVCNDDNEIKNVAKSVQNINFHVIEMRSTMTLEQIITVNNQWKSLCNDLDNLVLICTDTNLSMCNITEASVLIHYSLPPSLSVFHNRISAIMDSFPNMWDDSVDDSTKADMVTFIDETNEIQFPKLMNFARRSGYIVNDNLKTKIDQLLQINERKKFKSNIAICDELLNYGVCYDNANCNRRHLLNSTDDALESWIPNSGYIKFQILNVFNILNYSIRILERVTLKGETIKIRQNNLNFSLRLLAYYLNDENRRPVKDPKPGYVCCVEMKKNEFYRCRVLKASSRGRGKYSLNLIDRDEDVTCESYELYELPKELGSSPVDIVKVRIAGLIPSDMTNNRNKICNDKFINLITSELDGCHMKGKIVLGFDNCLWLDSVQCCQNLSTCERTAVTLNVKQYLLENQMAKENKNQIQSLYELCEKCSFSLPEYNLPKVEGVQPRETSLERKKPAPQWAHLNTESVDEIYITHVINPDLFFVKLKKWDGVIKSLLKDLEHHANQFDFGDATSDDFEYDVGDLCIVQYSDMTYNRARIDGKKAHGADSKEDTYKCFFVDVGDWGDVKKKDIYPISPELITKLPFQAIECRLLGIKPKSEKWTGECVHYMSELPFESPESNYWKRYVAVTDSTEEPDHTNGFKYPIAIYDSLTLLNDGFVDENFALYDDSEKERFSGFGDKIKEYLEVQEKMTERYVDDDDEIVKSDDVEMSFEALKRSMEKQMREMNFNEESFNDDKWEFVDFGLTPNQYLTEKNKLIEVPDDFSVKNIDNVFDQKTRSKESDSHKKTSPKLNNPKAPLMSDYKTPRVRWWENKKFVFVKIDIVGVTNYVLNLDDMSMDFETVVKGDTYRLKLNFVGGIKQSESHHSSRGLYVYLKLAKIYCRLWEDLVMGDQPKWIQYEIENCSSSDEEDEREVLRKNKEKLDMINYIIDNDSDDEGDIEGIDNLLLDTDSDPTNQEIMQLVMKAAAENATTGDKK